ncbi:hypothetical protein M3Y94_00936200 [Aphelenchoides besseyi]|nr:hypothetical protein M3Y94_00936200 [Aphelenchoides besseyi]KAI6224946.1 hypothetical protein M3Y95_00806100 [Aphelenchoides besseyi]
MGATESTPGNASLRSQRRTAEENDRDESDPMVLDQDALPLIVPTNCVIRIFSCLRPDDLHSARLVCRCWNYVINEIGRNEMQRRQLDAVEISSDCEFRIKCDMGVRVQSVTFKKYFTDLDIHSAQRRMFFVKTPLLNLQYSSDSWRRPFSRNLPRRRGVRSQQEVREEEAPARREVINEARALGIELPPVSDNNREVPDVHIPPYTYACGHTFYGNVERIPRNFCFQLDRHHQMYGRICGRRNYDIYNRNVRYASKLFTPPYDFYVRLELLLRHADVRQLVFINFTFTNLFVEKMEEFFGTNLPVEKLFIHNCSFKYISCANFHRLAGHILTPECVYIERPRNVLPDHFNYQLLETPAFLRATTIYIDCPMGRRVGDFGDPVHCNITRVQFMNWLDMRTQAAQHFTTPINAVFFGISHVTFNEDDVIRDYATEYNQLPSRTHLFRHVVLSRRNFFDTSRY